MPTIEDGDAPEGLAVLSLGHDVDFELGIGGDIDKDKGVFYCRPLRGGIAFVVRHEHFAWPELRDIPTRSVEGFGLAQCVSSVLVGVVGVLIGDSIFVGGIPRIIIEYEGWSSCRCTLIVAITPRVAEVFFIIEGKGNFAANEVEDRVH